MNSTFPQPTGTVRIGERAVQRLGFGAMRITGQGVWGPPKDRRSAIALLHRVVELGIDFIDTADSYGPNVSEELIAEALAPYLRGLVVATKGGLTRPGPGEWVADGRPAHLRQACEGSLRRLRVETIELYQLHTIDRNVPLAESVGALADLRREGKIRNVGLSNVTVAQYGEAKRIVPIVSVQNAYNLSDRESDDVVDACARDGVALIPWFPLDAGALTEHRDALGRIARSHDATAAQVALAWLLRRSPTMLPIPGTSSIAHVEENLGATRLTLSDEEFAVLARR